VGRMRKVAMIVVGEMQIAVTGQMPTTVKSGV